MIREAAARHGTIPFARFMDLALYCPNFGYYEQLDASPGRHGDFYTSVSVGPLFGELLASRFASWLENAFITSPATSHVTVAENVSFHPPSPVPPHVADNVSFQLPSPSEGRGLG